MAEQIKSPGWYPDPDGKPGERWWNGAGWSDSHRGGASVPTRAAAMPAPVAPPTAASARPPVYSAQNPAPQYPGAPPTLARVTSGRSLSMSANRNAMIGFITGLIGLFFTFFFVLGPVAIVFSALGIAKARTLRAQGVPGDLMVFAIIGLVSGVVATITGIIGVVAFMVPFLQLSAT